ncbi:hypothetical protein [Alkalidesulfovibrio alkalitolerans]|jgi:hypothetical protein|uniref:hypothetical protein n=1 Tax=Alkalidesulfovibrio alkalitolerans TaxID=293256 RepID=UPI0012947E80|nr:hypothetical protein [Alkalidesulfovibrio alkalitolerans]
MELNIAFSRCKGAAKISRRPAYRKGDASHIPEIVNTLILLDKKVFTAHSGPMG